MRMVQVQKGKKPEKVIVTDDLPNDVASLELEAISLAGKNHDSMYDLGRVLRKLINKPGNQPGNVRGYCGGKYSNFPSFCRHALGFSMGKAYKWMQVTDNFSREQVRSFGIARCTVVLQCTGTVFDRRRAIQMLQDGKTMREIMAVFKPNRIVSQTAKAGGGMSYRQICLAANALSVKEKLELAQRLFDSVKKAGQAN